MIMLNKQNNFILLRVYIASTEGIWEDLFLHVKCDMADNHLNTIFNNICLSNAFSSLFVRKSYQEHI